MEDKQHDLDASEQEGQPGPAPWTGPWGGARELRARPELKAESSVKFISAFFPVRGAIFYQSIYHLRQIILSIKN